MRLLLTLFFIPLVLPCFSQGTEVFGKGGNIRFPQFNFGRAEFDSLIYYNKRMPASVLLLSDLSIKVRVSFFVDTAGNVSNVTSTGYYYTIFNSGSVYNNDPDVEKEISEYRVLQIAGTRWTAAMLDTMKKDLKQESVRLIALTTGLWSPAVVSGKKTGKQVYTFITYHLDKEIAKKLVSVRRSEKDTTVLKITFDRFKNQKTLYNTGVIKMQAKMYPLAIAYFQQALEYNPQDIDALYNLGIAYKKQNKKDEACETWRKGAVLGDKEQAALVTKFCN